MSNYRQIVVAAALMVAAAGCGSSSPASGSMGAAGVGGGGPGIAGSGGGAAVTTIKLEVWMDGISKNGEVDVSTMPDNVLFTVTDKQPVSAAEAATAPAAAGKVNIVYDEDPAALRPLLQADPRFEAP